MLARQANAPDSTTVGASTQEPLSLAETRFSLSLYGEPQQQLVVWSFPLSTCSYGQLLDFSFVEPESLYS